MANEDRPTKEDEGPIDAAFDEPHDETSEGAEIVQVDGEAEAEGVVAATQLGATRYVIAGYFAAGILTAFIFGKLLAAGWTRLAEMQSVVDRLPAITQVAEDGRATWATIVGGFLAIGLAAYLYRRQDVRTWVNDAAAELAKVTWPSKKEVTNGTVVVVVTSIVATVFVALLDRFWGFVTDLVYRV